MMMLEEGVEQVEVWRLLWCGGEGRGNTVETAAQVVFIVETVPPS